MQVHSLLQQLHTTETKHFALPKTVEDLQKARIKSISKKTRKDTSYCVRLWASWPDYRTTTTGISIPPLAVLYLHLLKTLSIGSFVSSMKFERRMVWNIHLIHYIILSRESYVIFVMTVGNQRWISSKILNSLTCVLH